MKFLKKNKIKILWIFVFCIFLISIFSNTLGVSYESPDFNVGIVTAKILNIRCGPGLEFKKIGKVNKGEYIDVFAKIDDWYIIKTKDNIVGTVSKKYVVPSNSEELLIDFDEKDENNIILETNTTEFANSNGLTKEEQEFLNLINSNREINGFPKLEIDDEVQNIARLKAKDLVENNYFSHVSEKYGDISAMLNDNNINFKTVGENIAGNNTLAGAVEAWMNSENHKNNILSLDYNYTGVAMVNSERYGKVFVQIFIGK